MPRTGSILLKFHSSSTRASSTVYPRYDGPGESKSCRYNELSLYEVQLIVCGVGLVVEHRVVITGMSL
jgi:hypothetical protein